MIKNREEVEKELEDWLTEPKREDDLLRHYVESIEYHISKIRKDDIDGVVAWAEEIYLEKEDFNKDTFDGINRGYHLALSDIIAHLKNLKEKV
jgi:hypothetical protein